jgi:hypothetical protein
VVEKLYTRRPAEHRLPQIKETATLRRSKNGWILVFRLPRAFRLLEMSFIVPIPDVVVKALPESVLAEMAKEPKVPVFVRMFVDASQEDSPGGQSEVG